MLFCACKIFLLKRHEITLITSFILLLTFVNVDCNNWHNIIKRQSIHVKQNYHKDTSKDSHNLINCFEKPEVTSYYHSDNVYRERCNKCPKVLEVIARAKAKCLALKGIAKLYKKVMKIKI